MAHTINDVYRWGAEGVLFAEKDFNLAEHPEIEGVPNLQVIKLMQSFASKEYVTERFAWRHYYWCALCRCASSARQIGGKWDHIP